jgi:hypothetical protein
MVYVFDVSPLCEVAHSPLGQTGLYISSSMVLVTALGSVLGKRVPSSQIPTNGYTGVAIGVCGRTTAAEQTAGDCSSLSLAPRFRPSTRKASS